ncbi:MAG: hypothetical protein AAF456_19490, partial [Planctomycetota bacterium]
CIPTWALAFVFTSQFAQGLRRACPSIESYRQYRLDSVEGQVRKPDSLFVECRKPEKCRFSRSIA